MSYQENRIARICGELRESEFITSWGFNGDDTVTVTDGTAETTLTFDDFERALDSALRRFLVVLRVGEHMPDTVVQGAMLVRRGHGEQF